MIVVVDYGLGNVQAIVNIYERLGIPIALAKSAKDLAKASHLILPGVGAFDWAMDRFLSSGMRETLDQLVLEDNKPILGICIGMHMMAQRSDEGSSMGLGWLDAEVKLFDTGLLDEQIQLPHMGWNSIVTSKGSKLFEGLEDPALFYFLHSYYFSPNNLDDVAAYTKYGTQFTCAVHCQNIYGVQFHPEKSHGWGIQLLKNFASL